MERVYYMVYTLVYERWFICRVVMHIIQRMVLILDGNSEIGAHVWSNLGFFCPG